MEELTVDELSVEARLAQTRERLARTFLRLEGHVRDSIQAIDILTREKHDLQRRSDELSDLFEQERSNTEQRERLYASSQVEAEERSAALSRLAARHQEQEATIEDYSRTIERLEEAVVGHAKLLADRELAEVDLRAELAASATMLASANERIQQVSAERDEYKNMLYAKEREDAAYVIKLTEDERGAAIGSIDELLNRIESIEMGLEQATA